MTRRHTMVSSLVLFLLLSSSASADEPIVIVNEREPRVELDAALRLDLSRLRYYEPDDYDVVDSLTMSRTPAGSLRVEFAGFHQFALRHIRSEYRRFVRRSIRRGWYVRPEERDHKPIYQSRAERDFTGGFGNGSWWQRSWFESLPPEKGGAPSRAVVHTIGEDTAWEYGPITITNSFNLHFNYIAFFELNPNPVETQGARPERKATLDIRPATNSRVGGTDFSFDLKPRIRVGMPKGGDWNSILRELSLRGSVDLRHRGVKIIEGEVEVSWDPEGGAQVTFELVLANW